MWWIAAGLLSGFGWLCLSWSQFFNGKLLRQLNTRGDKSSSSSPGGWLLLLGFVLIDVVLRFWLPTLLASPRTHRFVVLVLLTCLEVVDHETHFAIGVGGTGAKCIEALVHLHARGLLVDPTAHLLVLGYHRAR